jgi:hypothetical protein
MEEIGFYGNRRFVWSGRLGRGEPESSDLFFLSLIMICGLSRKNLLRL